MQVEESRVTLLQLKAQVLIDLEPAIDFPNAISLDIEGDPFAWEISLLGNMGAYFHCKLNSHAWKECPALKTIQIFLRFLLKLKDNKGNTITKSHEEMGIRKIMQILIVKNLQWKVIK